MSNISPFGSCYRKHQCFHSDKFSKVSISSSFSGKQWLKGSPKKKTTKVPPNKKRKPDPCNPLSLPPLPSFLPLLLHLPILCEKRRRCLKAAQSPGRSCEFQSHVLAPELLKNHRRLPPAVSGKRTPERRRPQAWDMRDKHSTEDFHRLLDTVSWQPSRRSDRAPWTSTHTHKDHATYGYRRKLWVHCFTSSS